MRLFFAILGVFAITGPSFAGTVPADGTFDGKTVDAVVGDVVEISLEGNPTTGYSWAVQQVNGASVKQTGEAEYKQANNDGRVGGGGTFVFKFTVEKAGQSTLQLGYARPWEKVEPVRKFSLTVKSADKAPATQPATKPTTQPAPQR